MADSRTALLEAFGKLRVADVRDGLDWMMLHDKGTVSSAIRPLWRTTVCGFARTARYIPSEKTVPDMGPEEYTSYVSDYWSDLSRARFADDIEDGDIIVLDASDTDVGIIGSNNLLGWYRRGARGAVTNGGMRDTDEIIMQKIPAFCRHVSQPRFEGRVEYQDKNIPVHIGGVLVRPGDIVVGDGDGVVVVPIEKAEDVAKYALQENQKDREGRRRHYEGLGWELDQTVL